MDSLSLLHCNTHKLRCGNKDWISGLPDEILVYILSFLTTKEALSSCLLSNRWRHVWAYVPALKFDAPKILNEFASKRDFDSVIDERKKYLRSVNRVLSSYKAPTVDEFTLRGYLDEYSSNAISKCIKFAAEKKVKRLEMDFRGPMGRRHRIGTWDLYYFPGIYLLYSLTSLKLAFVNVTAEVLESIIYNSKALEVLSVTVSRVLGAVKVVGPSLKLKSLGILHCTRLKSLEISAPNLVSVSYGGNNLCIHFKSTPKLAELSICLKVDKPDLLMSFINHQIEVLKLNMIFYKQAKLFCEVFPQCTRLKMLDVRCGPEWEKDLFCVSSLIKACPVLHKLVVRFDSYHFNGDRERLKITGEEAWCHSYLKIVEIVGFVISSLQFATYLVENVVSLEKIIIDPLPPFRLRTSEDYDANDNMEIIRARMQAEKLRATLKPGTKLEIR